MDLFCPFCRAKLPGGVPCQGQVVVCPGCNAQVQMPLSDAQIRQRRQAAGWQMVMSIVFLGLAVLLLARGCALLNLLQ